VLPKNKKTKKKTEEERMNPNVFGVVWTPIIPANWEAEAEGS
jgi:hypothetical protein